MPHATLKLIPGVDQNRTPVLNEAAISECQFIRFVPDKQGLGLVQKLGGWDSFYTGGNQGAIDSVIRALWAWEDTNALTYLGVGCETRTAIITNVSGNGSTITITVSDATGFVVNESIVIYDVTPDDYNGVYTISSVSGNVITVAGTATGAMTVAGTIYSSDTLLVIQNNALTPITPRFEELDPALQATAPSLPPPADEIYFTTISGSSIVTVTLLDSKVYNTDFVYIKTQVSVGGIILFGLYSCGLVDAANQFIIDAGVNATSSTSNAVLPTFNFSNNSFDVEVNLPANTYQAGDTFTVLVPVLNIDPVTGSTVRIYGNYIIQSIVSAGTSFKIYAKNQSKYTETVILNNNNVDLILYKTPGATPSGLAYGTGIYGDGLYGNGLVPNVGSTGYQISAVDWTLDNWGQIFISCPIGGPIFAWDPTSGVSQAQIINNSPMANDGMFVAMPQRQIVAWGSTFTGISDPLLIRWSDVENYTSWDATPINQAGSYRLPRGSKIVGCIQGPQQGLVWTDVALWAMQYSGPPFVYQFNEIGTGCGLIARKAATSMNGIVYWMGQSQFYKLSGSGVEIITCPIWDVIFQDLDMDNKNKIRAAANSRFGEMTWYYPSESNGGEVNKYVKYNVNLNTWDFGTLSRTAWINESVLGAPIGAGLTDTTSYIYQHETSSNAGNNTAMSSSFQTGYFAITDGEYKIFIDQVWPDMKWGYYGGDNNADVYIQFYVKDYPTDPDRIYPPIDSSPYGYLMTADGPDYLTPRFRGRLVSIKIQSNDLNSFWRIGGIRYRFEQDGKF